MIHVVLVAVCAECGRCKTQKWEHLVNGLPEVLENSLPEDWFIHDNRVLCDAHEVQVRVHPRGHPPS